MRELKTRNARNLPKTNQLPLSTLSSIFHSKKICFLHQIIKNRIKTTKIDEPSTPIAHHCRRSVKGNKVINYAYL